MVLLQDLLNVFVVHLEMSFSPAFIMSSKGIGAFLINSYVSLMSSCWCVCSLPCVVFIFCFSLSTDFHKAAPYVVTGSVDQTVKVWECR